VLQVRYTACNGLRRRPLRNRRRRRSRPLLRGTVGPVAA